MGRYFPPTQTSLLLDSTKNHLVLDEGPHGLPLQATRVGFLGLAEEGNLVLQGGSHPAAQLVLQHGRNVHAARADKLGASGGNFLTEQKTEGALLPLCLSGRSLAFRECWCRHASASSEGAGAQRAEVSKKAAAAYNGDALIRHVRA